MSLFSPVNGQSTCAIRRYSVYFLRETKMADDCRAHSSAVAYLRTSIPLGHSTADAPGFCEVWWRFSNGRVRRSRTAVLNSSF